MMNVARVYLRVSTNEQELTRQNSIIEDARSKGFYIAGVYGVRGPMERKCTIRR